jgi:two-component system, NarL family, sensor kinase
VRHAIVGFLVTGLLVLLVVAVPVAVWVRGVSHEIVVRDALERTQRLADDVVSTAIVDGLQGGSPAALAQVEDRLAPWVTDETILRVKIWDAEGTVLYSDVPELIGSTVDLEPWAQQLLAGGPGTVSVGEQAEDENMHEAGDGELVGVYVASHAAAHDPVLVEVYFDDEVLLGPQGHTLLRMTPVLLGAMAVLQGAQLIPGIRLARQVQDRQRERRAILQQAIEAGERERVRLAVALHDDILQDLAGLAYTLEPADDASSVQDPGAVLRQSIVKLRAITSDLYSSPVDADTLPSALGVLAERTRNREITTVVHIAQDSGLDEAQATACHRIAREAMMNVIKHAQATSVHLGLARRGREVTLSISDDGVGFDTGAPAAPGHFGLRMMADVADSVGARLATRCSPAGGTEITVTFPAPAPPHRLNRASPSSAPGRATLVFHKLFRPHSLQGGHGTGR